MNKIKPSLHRLKQSSLLPFLILFLLMLVVHAAIYVDFGDDVRTQNRILEMGIWGNAVYLYKTWSTRFIIELIFPTVLMQSVWVWRILDSAIIVLLAYSLSKLFVTQNKQRNNWYIVGLILLYPWMHMMTAGWVATTANYLWVLTLGLYSLTPLRSILDNEKLPWYRCLLPCLAVLYAANQEQMAALLFGFLVVIILYLAITQKRTHALLIIQLLLVLGMFCFIFTGPGNPKRNASEIILNYPDFALHSTLERLYLMFMETGNRFIAAPNLIFTAASVLTFLNIWAQRSEALYRVIAGVPLGACMTFGIFQPIAAGFFPSLELIKSKIANLSNFNQKSLYIPLFLYILIFGCLAISLYLAFSNSRMGWFSILLLGAGVASHLIMAFSPTMYASGVRTEIFLYFSLVIIALLLIRCLYEEKQWRYTHLVGGSVAVLSSISYINFWLSV